MTLNATLNPDFSQVETDQLQARRQRQLRPVLPGEAPVLPRGRGLLHHQYDVLYTRQIADPDYGLRVTGRSGGSTYGAIVARDAAPQVLVPGVLGSGFEALDEKVDVAVGRYRYDFNEHASLGVIGTFREGDQYSNDVVGVDGRWKQGPHTVTAQFLHSQSGIRRSSSIARLAMA